MSPPGASPSDPMIVELHETNSSVEEVLAVMDSLKMQVASNRRVYIKRRMQENTDKVVEVTKNLYKLSEERTGFKITCGGGAVDLLAKRQQDAVNMHNGIGTSNGYNESNSSLEDGYAPSAILLGSHIAVKHAVRPNKLSEVKTLPPYTTWVFLNRNQRMTEDQSIVGRRRIYYGQTGGEALICSDSEEEAANDEEEKEKEKKEFVQSEDYILRKTIEEVGFSDSTFDLLAQFLSRKPCDIKGRYEDLMNNNGAVHRLNNGNVEWFMNPYIDKGLDYALDSFDSLFCRRCLVFDCRLHGCSQEPVFPVDKHIEWPCQDVEKGPCGPNCHLLVLESKAAPSSNGSTMQGPKEKYGVSFIRKKSKSFQIGSVSSSDVKPAHNISSSSKSTSGGDKRSSKRIAENVVVAEKKRQKKKATSDSDSVAADILSLKDLNLDPRTWKPLEIAMYEMGIQIFGRNSCMIARNIMIGLKNCSEISKFMNHSEEKTLSRDNDGTTLANGCPKDDANEIAGGGARRRSKFLRRRGKVRRLKFTWKSAGSQSLRKRISERKERPCRQYSPCGCKSGCGKKCPCLENGTCCEKYCGCPKSCKNRFRGCHCAKSHCGTRQCPCFAANRECDPDVCRNCWIGCGDGSLGVPSQGGDNYECKNMKLLLKQQQRVLLGRSDISGWGAFLKNTVGKHAYLGEYTGELISHHEADKRGKIYDRENSSFLFNLNDQFVLDAYRRGDKLKFANHSPEPNCYAKVMMVAGDHRVGIFANERISGGEELFYDYRYEPDQAPAWAKKPDAPGAKREEGGPSNGRAKKHT